ncbi:MAG: GNAT family N-acetyltransferase [Gemmatimonadales bacterium]
MMNTDGGSPMHRVDAFWAAELGIDPTRLRAESWREVESPAASDPAGLRVLAVPEATILSYTRGIRTRLAEAGFDAAALRRSPRENLSLLHRSANLLVRGPAWLGYWLSGTPPEPGIDAAPFAAVERHRLHHLQATDPAGWEEAGVTDAGLIFGVERDSMLAAVAGYEPWHSDIAHLQVFCHPGHRGTGAADAALREAVRHALERGLIPQYRAADRNPASRRLAERLGFMEYGWMAVVRLRNRLP